MKMISTRNFSFDGDHLSEPAEYCSVAVAGQRRRL